MLSNCSLNLKPSQLPYFVVSTSADNSNPFIWSSWGYLERRSGNAALARRLFDAATVVDEEHACAWHNWGLLEKEEGNYPRARDLWTKGIAK